MTEFPKIEARFEAALSALKDAAGGTEDTEKVAGLEADLAQAQKKLKAAKKAEQAAQDAAKEQVEALEAQAARLEEARAEAQEETRRVKQFNKHLKKLNADLRDANAKNVGDADLINASLESEIEQIQAQRAADLAEVNGILARMTPLVEGSADG